MSESLFPKPLWGEYYHWSLDLYDENQDTHWVVEALGEPYCFTASSDDYDPKSLPGWRKCIYVSRLEQVEVEDLQGIIESVPIRNDLAYWNCQDCVIEILDALEEAELVKKTSDYEYVKAALIQMVGPVEDTRHHILAYRAIGEEGKDEDYGRCDENEADGGASEDDKKTHRVLSEDLWPILTMRMRRNREQSAECGLWIARKRLVEDEELTLLVSVPLIVIRKPVPCRIQRGFMS